MFTQFPPMALSVSPIQYTPSLVTTKMSWECTHTMADLADPEVLSVLLGRAGVLNIPLL